MLKKSFAVAAALSMLFATSAQAADHEDETALGGGAGGVGSELQFVEDDENPFSSNVSLVNNYLYRGLTQTAGRPAIQGGFDAEISGGFYAGVWGSSISWLNDLYGASAGTLGAQGSSLELDTFVGYKHKLPSGVAYNVGFLRYNFPGTYAAGTPSANTNELYAEVGYHMFNAKYSYSLGNTFGNANTTGTDYFEINAEVPVHAVEAMAVGLHAGRQNFKGIGAVDAAGNTLSYNDYKINVAKEFNDYVASIGYSKTNASAAYTPLGTNQGRGAFVLSLAHTF